MKTLLLLLLLIPVSVSAQVALTPIEVRRANELLDRGQRLEDQHRTDSTELAAYRDAMATAAELQAVTDGQLKDCEELVGIGQERERNLEDTVRNASKIAKRRERLAWILGGIAAAEAVVIGVVYGVKR